jgi:predicted RNase H-like HicB family nuclease
VYDPRIRYPEPRQKEGMTMRFQGKLYRDGKWWLAEVPVFDAMTQGRTRKEALDMIADWFITMVDRKGFWVYVQLTGRDDFEVNSDDARTMISLLLQRQRQKSGLSLAQAAQRLGAKSRNAYARYEQGVSVPTVAKLDELLRAIAPDRGIVVRQSDAA